MKQTGQASHPLGKNPGDVWRLATANFRGAHFATFPTSLVETPLLATCPERVCITCGQPWQREPLCTLGHLVVTGELQPICSCAPAAWQPGLVLDPFFGAGTVGLVAEEHGRNWLGIDTNRDFVKLASKRLAKERKHKERTIQPDRRAA